VQLLTVRRAKFTVSVFILQTSIPKQLNTHAIIPTQAGIISAPSLETRVVPPRALGTES
jgi:hypothetical protein